MRLSNQIDDTSPTKLSRPEAAMSTLLSSQVPRSHFPARPQFSGFMKPSRVEGEVQNLEVYGEIPADIDGTFYRVMPDPQFTPFIENDPVR